MSVCNRHGLQVDLIRSGPDQFQRKLADFAGDNDLRWKYLAMLVLRENGGWHLDWIGKVFGHPKGHVTRCLRRVKRQLREHLEADVLEDDPLFADD